MKKFPVRLGLKPVTLAGPEGSVKLSLEDFEFSPDDILWSIYVDGRLVEGTGLKNEILSPQWAGSFITLSVPLKVHIDPVRPEFIVRVPNGTRMV